MTALLHLSLKTKLIIFILIVSAAVISVYSYGINSVSQVDKEHHARDHTNILALQHLHTLHSSAASLRANLILYQENIYYDSVAKDSQALKTLLQTDLQNITISEGDFHKAQAAWESENPEGKRISYEPIMQARQQLTTALSSLVTLKEKAATDTTFKTKKTEVLQSQSRLAEAIDSALAQKITDIKNSQETADNDLNQAARQAFLIFVVAVIGGISLSIITVSVITNRVKKLREGIAHIAAGDFRYKVVIRSRDELGQLAESFNQMSHRLQDSYQRIAFAKQRDEALIESMSEGLVAVDEAGKVVLLNKKAIQLFTISDSDAAIGKALTDLAKIYTGRDRAVADKEHPAMVTLKSGKPTSDVFAYKDKTGTKLLSISSSPVVLDKKVAGAIIIVRDVTKEKEVDRMKTEFISLASHQLRTPLSAIKWFSEMLLNGDAGKLSEEQADFTKNIADSTERMIELVNSLLNISRIESGRIIVDPKPTDLEELVSGIINDLKAKTAEKEQSLVVSVHKDLAKINLDPHLIGQVYLNFLTNAIKYTPKGGEISVIISKKDDKVISQVTDNGYGIPKTQQDRVFQKFFRAENVAKFETDGTGLGLYLVKAIIESSGGEVWFESEEGKGTTFWFTIPLSGMKAKAGEVTLDE